MEPSSSKRPSGGGEKIERTPRIGVLSETFNILQKVVALVEHVKILLVEVAWKRLCKVLFEFSKDNIAGYDGVQSTSTQGYEEAARDTQDKVENVHIALEEVHVGDKDIIGLGERDGIEKDETLFLSRRRILSWIGIEAVGLGTSRDGERDGVLPIKVEEANGASEATIEIRCLELETGCLLGVGVQENGVGLIHQYVRLVKDPYRQAEALRSDLAWPRRERRR